VDTRERMVDVTARLLARQGYHATGLAQVLSESGAPRGSLYFHFPEGKEQMAAEAVRRLGEQLGAALQAKLDGKPDVRSGLESVARMFARQLEATEFALGCPVATTALEASDEAPALATACAEVFERWTVVLADRIRRERPRIAAPERLARTMLALIEGALLLARVRRSVEPLRDAELAIGTLLEG
jgi:TetR/AcrR family transcriptional regulator, lmrAB and yxaGH operons repressor